MEQELQKQFGKTVEVKNADALKDMGARWLGASRDMREASRKAFLHWKKILKLKNLNMEELVREKSELLEEALKSEALLTSRVEELDGQLALMQEGQDEAIDAATRSIQARASTLSNSMGKLAEQLAAETGRREAVEASLQQTESTVADLEVSIRTLAAIGRMQCLTHCLVSGVLSVRTRSSWRVSDGCS